jgi:predicted 3-demethylubiquinone-9 3-methyltransferase (glyoxalase superfamily)
MFQGQAEEAMRFYVSSFPNSEIRSISRYEDNEPGQKGSVRPATFSLNVKHAQWRPTICLNVLISFRATRRFRKTGVAGRKGIENDRG